MKKFFVTSLIALLATPAAFARGGSVTGGGSVGSDTAATYICKASKLTAGAVITVVDDSKAGAPTFSVVGTSQEVTKVPLDVSKPSDMLSMYYTVAKVQSSQVVSGIIYSTVINGMLAVNLVEFFDKDGNNIGQLYSGNSLPIACD